MAQIIISTDDMTAKRIEVIAKRNGNDLFDALSKSLLIARLREKLQNGIAHFAYKKLDGTTREAFGTTLSQLVGKHIKGGNNSSHFGTLSYFDVEKGDFRSFRLENIIAVE